MSEPRIYPGATICDGVTFGEGCVIGTHAYIGKACVLGDNVRVQHGAFIPNRTVIGDRVFLGPNCTLTDDKWPKVNNPHYHAEPPILEHDCNIGAGAVILPGVRIGEHATVGAGAVVTKDVLPFAVVVGCPAEPPVYKMPKTDTIATMLEKYPNHAQPESVPMPGMKVPKKDEYVPTPKELEGNHSSYCYMQQDAWSFPEQIPFISKPEESA